MILDKIKNKILGKKNEDIGKVRSHVLGEKNAPFPATRTRETSIGKGRPRRPPERTRETTISRGYTREGPSSPPPRRRTSQRPSLSSESGPPGLEPPSLPQERRDQGKVLDQLIFIKNEISNVKSQVETINERLKNMERYLEVNKKRTY